jgi:predicted nucleic acid-binding protein
LILVDTNILLDVATDDPEWFEWSAQAISEEALKGPLCINAIIYAEFSARYATIEAVDDFVARIGVQMLNIPRAAAFMAAKAHLLYRSTGGTRTAVLSDFFVGAHAATLDIPVLTRDVRRYRTYFPNLRVIAPQMN